MYYACSKDALKLVKIMTCLVVAGFVLAILKLGYTTTLTGFILYEISVGVFYPTYSTIKSEFIPSENRGTIMNIFKIPFNVVVIFLLVTMNKALTIDAVCCIIFSSLSLIWA